MSVPAKILSACHCCSTGLDHCSHCHDVPIHGVTSFNFISVVQGIPVYWGDDQASAVDAARRGAGYVTLSPILADFRELGGRHDFQPVLATPFGETVIPLDAVRLRRNADGAGYDYQRDTADAPIDWNSVFAQNVTAGATDYIRMGESRPEPNLRPADVADLPTNVGRWHIMSEGGSGGN